MKRKPKILIVPGWLDSTNVYAEYVMRHASNEFDFTKAFYEMVNPKEFDLIYPLYTTVGGEKDYPQERIVKVIFEGRELHGVHKNNAAVGAACDQEIAHAKNWLGTKEVHDLRFGIDENLFRPFKVRRSDAKFHVGFCGGITNPRKEFATIIEPLGSLPGISLLTSTLEGQVGTLRNWIGMPLFYNQLDVLVLASGQEGFCFPILEAAACGIPIIATNVGIVSEFVQQGGGFMIDPIIEGSEVKNKQEVSAFMQEKIAYFRSHPKQRKEMGMANRRFVEKSWTWEKRIKNYIAFFQAGLASPTDAKIGVHYDGN